MQLFAGDTVDVAKFAFALRSVQLEFHGVCTVVFAMCRRVLPQRARLIGVNYSDCSILKSEREPRLNRCRSRHSSRQPETQQSAFYRVLQIVRIIDDENAQRRKRKDPMPEFVVNFRNASIYLLQLDANVNSECK